MRRLEAQDEAILKRAERLRQAILACVFYGRLVLSEISEREAAEPATAGA